MMRICRAVEIVRVPAALVALLTLATLSGCGGGRLLRQYEYEEEIYLSLDGTATIYVNSSVAALDALRGATLDASFAARLDREAVRAFYSTPVTRVGRINQYRRSNRRFVYVRIDVDDIRQAGGAAPFSWSTYDFRREGDEYVYRQSIGAATKSGAVNAGWNGRELVAFRIHLPSKITSHNRESDFRRGNILALEQPLTDRLRGEPLTLDARMQTQSILYRTLFLFGGTVVAVAMTFALVIVVVLRSGTRRTGRAP
jgi:hypothetical protein